MPYAQPLLAARVLPTSLEGRVAHHMVKMGLTSSMADPQKAKDNCWLSPDVIRQLRKGEMNLNIRSVEAIAEAWGLPVSDFTRDYEDEELDEVEFYQASYCHRDAVRAALSAAIKNGPRGVGSKLAEYLGVSTAQVHHMLNPDKGMIVSWQAAKITSTMLSLEGGAYFVFDGLATPQDYRVERKPRGPNSVKKPKPPGQPRKRRMRDDDDEPLPPEKPTWRIIGRVDEPAR